MDRRKTRCRWYCGTRIGSRDPRFGKRNRRYCS
ncbi:hypothetical protein X777_00041 [Ooceraea biroi]|uniref:Uncharacterized protein n=1 Tax=Ooceraea biroi TaxID=2015173 RepID=A0A026VS21_OOCBI|nr:hypothetical protein X777_00041 [Ooceraea biroi]